MKKWLCEPITTNMIEEADAFYNSKLFNKEGWEYIVKNHDGKIPILIRAVPEGSVVPVKNVLFTVENTDVNVPWITNYFESLLVQLWYPMTVCTTSFHIKKLFKEYTEKTCENSSMLAWKMADFGFRGSTSVESAGIGGCGHYVIFDSSDNVYGKCIAQKFYHAPKPPGIMGIATEHSTMTTWQRNGENIAVKHLLLSNPDQPIGIVADSYDIWNFIDNILGKEMKDVIQSRHMPILVRPDSGDPVETLLKVLIKLEDAFGGITTNAKGYKLLPPYLAVIYGDGISSESLPELLSALETSQWSLDNVYFGSGGALLQKMDRDTQKCAFKCCMATINGENV